MKISEAIEILADLGIIDAPDLEEARDMAINVLTRYQDDLISRTELLHKIENLEKFNNSDCPEWVKNIIRGADI